MSSRIKISILVVVLIVLTGGVLFLLSSRSSSAHAYSCYYKDGWDYARCVVNDDDTGACYGYYDLIGSRPEDGIKTNSPRSTTCEGFIEGNHIYFDDKGKFIK